MFYIEFNRPLGALEEKCKATLICLSTQFQKKIDPRSFINPNLKNQGNLMENIGQRKIFISQITTS